jgi:hypothetical protein
MADRIDEGIKTFLSWQGIAHCLIVAYTLLWGYLCWDGYQRGANLTTQQTFVITTLTGVLPIMVNWYTNVMQALYQRLNVKGE